MYGVINMLTDKWLKANHKKPVEKAYEIADRDGMSVRISAKGKIVFQMRYSFAGKPKRASLGVYPAVTLKDARALNDELRLHLDRGEDPSLTLVRKKSNRSGLVTLRDWFAEWYEKDLKQKKSSHHEIWRSFELHIFPQIGSFDINQVTIDDWMDRFDVLSKTVPSITDRLLTNAKQCYRWLVRRKAVESNPLAEITAWNDLSVRKKNSYRSLDEAELKLVIEAFRESRMTLKNKIFVRLLLIYGCRPKELRISSPSDFDFNTRVWTVPAQNHKMGQKTNKPLLRPITADIETLVRDAIRLSGNSEFVFSGKNGVGSMSRSVPLPLPYGAMQWLRRHRGINMEHWSIYDLRKTARTNWSTLTQPHIAEIMLGHKLPGDWGTYDQYHYLPEQQAALEAWTARLFDLGMQI